MIIIYSLPVCPNCNTLKDILTAKGIKFENADLESPASKTKLLMGGVFTAVAPVMQIDDLFYTYDAIFKNGEVDMDWLTEATKEVETK